MDAHNNYFSEGGQFEMHDDEKTDHDQIMDGTYPDMNYIFLKGIPKMIQVADDMHRMTDYIMDLRNMTIGFACFSFMGVLIFLFLRQIQKRKSTDMRERMITANCPEDQRKSAQSHGDTCRKYSESWHAPTMKTSALKPFPESSFGKTKSTAKTDGCAEGIIFANTRNQKSH
uniref:Transmembrane protein n=1 Tax=Elaeophora elaphi TaxID=1147741 RepID=A0A0R3RXT1_9BILA